MDLLTTRSLQVRPLAPPDAARSDSPSPAGARRLSPAPLPVLHLLTSAPHRLRAGAYSISMATESDSRNPGRARARWSSAFSSKWPVGARQALFAPLELCQRRSSDREPSGRVGGWAEGFCDSESPGRARMRARVRGAPRREGGRKGGRGSPPCWRLPKKDCPVRLACTKYTPN